MAGVALSDTLESPDREFIPDRYFNKPTALKDVELYREDLKVTFLKCRCLSDCTCMSAAVDDIKSPIIIATDGGFRSPNDYTDARYALAAIGVFVADGSPMNASKTLKNATVNLTPEIAEGAAIITALAVVKQLKKELDGPSVVIIKTDNSDIVDSMVSEVDRWSGFEYYLYNHGRHKLDERLRATIGVAVTDLEDSTGVRVKFWWVPREWNVNADGLVKEAMDKENWALRAAKVNWQFHRRWVQQDRREKGLYGDLKEAQYMEQHSPRWLIPQTYAPQPWPLTEGPYGHQEIGLRSTISRSAIAPKNEDAPDAIKQDGMK